jgi:heat-inducible transcriptional repressor
MPDEIDERAREVLKAVIQEYISSGEPVGSGQLARRGEFDVSPATLRNVLGDLEELGFIEKPHTSAGRVPTDRGYRFYVDSLVRLRDPSPRERELIQSGLGRGAGMGERLAETGRLLHALTHHAVVVLAPHPAAAVLERIEFIRLREDRVLAVLVSRNGQVHNRAITVDFPVTSEELVRAGNYLNALLREVPLEGARERILAELEQERALYDALSTKALKLGMAATEVAEGERMRIEGTASFVQAPDADLERMRAIFRALEEKRQLLSLLDRVQQARELRIYIGTESEFSSAGDVSVIATPYKAGETVLGAVGVIGPTRMNYQRVIPLVSFTAQVLSRGLTGE